MSEARPIYQTQRDERVAAHVRQVLDVFNDDRIPVTTCVAKLAAAHSQTIDHLDLMIDEFQRIAASPGADDEITQLCERAIRNTRQKVPVIAQRDTLQAKVDQLTRELAATRNELRHHQHAPALDSSDGEYSR